MFRCRRAIASAVVVTLCNGAASVGLFAPRTAEGQDRLADRSPERADLNGPARVRPGHSYSFSVHGMRPRARIRGAMLTPTRHRGGSCCGIAVKFRAESDAAGRATVRFRWPLHYERCSGVSHCSTYAWVDRQRVDVALEVSSGQFPRMMVRITCGHGDGCTSVPGGT